MAISQRDFKEAYDKVMMRIVTGEQTPREAVEEVLEGEEELRDFLLDYLERRGVSMDEKLEYITEEEEKGESAEKTEH
jgi:hypothetical protein